MNYLYMLGGADGKKYLQTISLEKDGENLILKIVQELL